IGRPRSPEGFDNPDNDPRGPWRNTNCKSTVKDPREAYEVEDPATGRRFRDVWAFSPVEMARKAGAGELIFPKSQSGQVRMKEYFNEFRNANIPIKSSLGLYDAQYNTQYLTRLMGAKVFLNPKHIRLMRDLLAFTTQGDDIVLDFFGGSGTTADALLSLNAQDGQRRRFVLVQLDVPVEPTSAAGKAGYASIADLCRDRIDRAGAALDPAKAHPDWDGDTGYRVFDVGRAD
ncbi:MAG: DNA methyltransferase, partial [Alphaproteobacteria bacterium]